MYKISEKIKHVTDSSIFNNRYCNAVGAKATFVFGLLVVSSRHLYLALNCK